MAVYYGDKLVWSAGGSGGVAVKSYQFLEGAFLYGGSTTSSWDITTNGFSSVDYTKTVCLTGIYNNTYSGLADSESSLKAKMTNNTNITISRNTGANICAYGITLIEFENYVNVQTFETTLTNLSSGVPITAVNPQNSILFINSEIAGGGSCTHISLRPYFYSSTSVRLYGTHNSGNCMLYVVSFE
jgi:hypothetical protein